VFESEAREASLDLVWSLWTELGIPGPRRLHQPAILDLERLILVTPWFCRDDARITDLARAWCRQHSNHISAQRLDGLMRTAHPDIRNAAEPFLGDTELKGRRKLGARTSRPAPLADSRTLSVRIDRPALLQLRVRALVGVSGRADVILSLLAAPDAWVTAAELEEVGIAKRNVAVTLAGFAEAGIVSSRHRRNAREFRLSNASALGLVVALPDLAVFAPWAAIFEWMRLAEALSAVPAAKPVSLQVEVARQRETLEALALALGIPVPDVASRSAPVSVVGWLVETARAIADGVAPAVAGTATPIKNPAAHAPARTRAPRPPRRP